MARTKADLERENDELRSKLEEAYERLDETRDLVGSALGIEEVDEDDDEGEEADEDEADEEEEEPAPSRRR